MCIDYIVSLWYNVFGLYEWVFGIKYFFYIGIFIKLVWIFFVFVFKFE